jgi:hypothetical protein
MIAPGTRITIVVVPLEQIVVTEHQRRYPEQAWRYARLLDDPTYADHFAGIVSLAPTGGYDAQGEPIYTLLDGHHRYVASILAGRAHLLAAIHSPPSDEPTTLRPFDGN